MKPIPWFNRSFSPITNNDLFPTIIERLNSTPSKLGDAISNIESTYYTQKYADNKWTIQEQVGHLLSLEVLWLGRVIDIKTQQPFLRTADLTNQATFDAQFNKQVISDLLTSFTRSRTSLVAYLEEMRMEDLEKTAFHPRLKTPMKMVDLAFFVAEHDDHHLAYIEWIYQHLLE